MVNINTSLYDSSGGAPPAPGSEIGGAQLQRLVAQDDFSSIWVTEPLEDEMGETCIRVIPASILKGRDARKRFRTELAFWQRMRSDHVVDLYDLGWDHGYYYMLMRFMTLGSLEHMLETENVQGMTISSFAIAFAQALRDLHGSAGAHGCLKPSNVFPENPKLVRLSDFAIPLWFDEAQDEMSPVRAHLLHPYRAPEQHVNPRDYDTRSDVFSYGLILLRSLTGQAPTLSGRITDEGTVDWPPGLDRVVPQCLAEDPTARFADGYELYEALREAMESTEADLFRAGVNAGEMESLEDTDEAEPAATQPDEGDITVIGEPVEEPGAADEVTVTPEEILEQARECVEGGQFDEALTLMEQLDPGMDGMHELLDEIENRQAACRDMTAEAIRLAEMGNSEAALETVKQAEKLWRGSSTLMAVKSELAASTGKLESELDTDTPSALEFALDNGDYNRARTLLEKELRRGTMTESLANAVRRFKHGRVRRAFLDNIRNGRRLYALDHGDEAAECWREAARWLAPGPEKNRLRRIAQAAREGTLELDLRNVAVAAQARAAVEQDAREITPQAADRLAALGKDLPPDLQARIKDRLGTVPEGEKSDAMKRLAVIAVMAGVGLLILILATRLLVNIVTH